MKTLPLSEVKAKLSELVSQVTDTDARIVVTRNGRAVAVLMSQDDYESWVETTEILSDTRVMREIRKALRTPRRKLRRYTVEGLFGD